MVPPLSIEAKAALIDTARSLWNRDEHTALVHFSRLEPPVEHAIYQRLWETMGRPATHPDFGRAAFWGRDGQTAPLLQKVKAVEHALSTRDDIPIEISRDIRQIPSGAIPVVRDAHNDCGLDPRFSFDGKYINPAKQLSLWETLLSYVTYLEFVLRSYLSFDPEERTFRQMFLSSAKAELAWAKTTENTFTISYDSADFVWTREYDFLECASAFYKHLHPQTDERLYPNELLIPIHCINHPQGSSWDKRCAKPDWENGDLSRTAGFGFWRLSQNLYRPNTRSGAPLDPIEYKYVPHYLFIHAMQAPSDALKTALREYRSELASITTDAKCARSFQACKERLLPKLEAFHAAWNNYINSHELLQEVQAFFATVDHYRSHRDYVRKWMPSNCWLFSKFKEKIQVFLPDDSFVSDENYRLHGKTAYDSLKTTVLRDFPHSPSARLLTTYDERFPTRG